jgi:hypothetical protein
MEDQPVNIREHYLNRMATLSLIFGAASITPVIFTQFIEPLSGFTLFGFIYLSIPSLIAFFVFIGVCAILGLIFGIKGLKSLRLSALAGIIFSSIIILLFISMLQLWIITGEF